MSREAPSTVRDLRRGQILAAARRVVVEQGLEALTFAALEERLDFTRGVMTWHFANKGEIVRALLDEAIAAIDATALPAILSEATLTDRARAVVREMVKGWLGEEDAGQVLVSFWGRLRSDPDAAALNAALFARYRRYSADLVRIGQERGEFREDADPEATGAILVAVVIGLALQATFVPGAIDPEQVAAAAGDAVVAWLRDPPPDPARTPIRSR
jgi:AcrR family transcriptional regulator